MIDIYNLTQKEFNRQKNTLNLIASENYPSPQVLSLLGSVWSTKYAEGLPTKRYYAGNILVDELEIECMSLALEVFKADGYGVNVQMLSGSPANSVLNYGDTVLCLSLKNGGHLSHLHETSVYNKYFKFENYDLIENSHNNFEIDIEQFESQLKKVQPKLVILGFSSYPRQVDFKPLIKLVHAHGALVLADVSHINGLIATGLHSSPFSKGGDGADFVTMTTHKTLRGPRSAMVFAKVEFMPHINKAIFPGSMGGPHINKIAALTRCLQEIIGQEQYPDTRSFMEYQKQVLVNCKMLENELSKNFEVISPTQTHLCLIKLPENLDSLEIQNKLEQTGLITNRNILPRDTKSPWRPSGLRLGSAALTSRGAGESEFMKIADVLTRVCHGTKEIDETSHVIQEITNSLHWYYDELTDLKR
jgi:glycine hydroxymethyltransferase